MNHDITQAVRGFIAENFLFRDEAGIIDSTGVLELVSFLETTFGIEVADEDMLPENLDSIRAITGYVSRKLSERRIALVA